MTNPAQVNARMMLTAAEADGALDVFVRAGLTRDQLAPFLSFIEGVIDAQLTRERLADEQGQREHVAAEHLERERRERESLPLEQRSPICLPGAGRRRTLCPRGLIGAIGARHEAAHRSAPRRAPGMRQARAALSFLDTIEHELDQLGDPATMTPAELADHVARIVVGPVGKLSIAEATAVARAVLLPASDRARGNARHRGGHPRERRVRRCSHRIRGRGPRAPALADAPPEPPSRDAGTLAAGCA